MLTMSETNTKTSIFTGNIDRLGTCQEAANSLVLAWGKHPARQQPQRVPLFCAVLLLGVGCGYEIFHQVLPAVSAALILLYAGSEYLLPQECIKSIVKG